MSDQHERVTERGNLLEINWANLSAELHTPMGIVRLEFAEDLAETMRAAARQRVAITGVRRITPDGFVRATAVESVQVLERSPILFDFDAMTDVKLTRSQQSDPFDFEHPDWPHDDVLDQWVENILNRKYKD